ncbi:hypothetical protein ACMFMF_002605 [Clarireedia jacksonii]
MDMDDPWGSPWADELDNDNDNRGLDNQRNNDNGSGNADVEKASNALRNKLDATWVNSNDGFTDWEADTGMGGAKENLEMDAAVDQWEIQKPNMQLAVGKDDLGGFEGQWNDFGTSPGREISRLAPSPMAKPRDMAREPSPDPWANAVVPDELPVLEGQAAPTANELILENNGTSVSSAPEPIFETLELTDETKHELVEVEKNEIFDNISTEMHREEPQEEPEEETIASTSETFKPAQTHEEETEDSEATTEVPEASNDDPIILEPGHESSRPSSSPSEGSHHDEPLPDSPRTSLDEEPKKSQIMREVSPEVQELVERSDVLIQEEEESNAAGPTPEVSKDDAAEDEKVIADDDEFGDFGEFEEEVSEGGDAAQDQIFAVDINERAEEKAMVKSVDNISDSQLPKTPSGPIDFVIDLTAVDKIFEKDELPAIDSSAEKIFIPDTIIADTFATTGERKTWYRISRYGPMRKHNAGDDENYVRITWQQSTAKEETQKIVARWMEEDQNNGHVVLGGTSKGGSLFGWNDPNAAPVPLAAVFAKRNSGRLGARSSTDLSSPELPREWPKNLTRDHSKSKTRSSSQSRDHSPAKSVDSTTSTVEVQPSTAQFDLGAFETTQTASEPGSPALESGNDVALSSALVPSDNSVPSAQGSLSRHSIEPPPQNRPLPKPRPLSMPPPATGAPNFISIPGIPTPSNNIEAIPAATVHNDDNDDNDDDDDDDYDDDDDEWGEMVSSPIITEAPKPPPLSHPHTLRHKRSMSLETPSFPIPNSTTPPLKNPQITKLQYGLHHRPHQKPKITFDEIISSQVDNPPPPISTKPEQRFTPSRPHTINTFSSTKSTAVSSPAISPVHPPPHPHLNSPFTTSDPWLSQPSSPAKSISSFADLWDSPPPPVSAVSEKQAQVDIPRNAGWDAPVPVSVMEQHSPVPQVANIGVHTQITKTATTATTATAGDPWALIDFSIFEGSASAPSPIAVSTPVSASFQPSHTRVLSHPVKSLHKSVAWSMSAPRSGSGSGSGSGSASGSRGVEFKSEMSSHSGVKLHSNQSGKSKQEIEQDELVRAVVGGLPDLGYIFKR